jgi:hypothetical protein
MLKGFLYPPLPKFSVDAHELNRQVYGRPCCITLDPGEPS